MIIQGRQWGRELGESLGQIGRVVRSKLDPGWIERAQLEQTLRDPEQAQKMADAFYQNPNLFREDDPMVGKDNFARIKALEPSLRVRNETEVARVMNEQLGNRATREAAASAGRPTTAGERTRDVNSATRSTQQVQQGKLELQELEATTAALAALRKKNPQLSEEQAFRQLTGMDRAKYELVQEDLRLYNEGKALNPVEGRRLIETIATSQDPQDYRRLEAFERANPNAYKLIVEQMDWEQRAALDEMRFRRQLSNSNRMSESERVFAAKLANAKSLADQYDISLGAAVANLGYSGGEFDSLRQGVTDEEISHTREQIQLVDDRRRQQVELGNSKAINDAIRGLNTVLKSSRDDRSNMPLYASQIQDYLTELESRTGRTVRVEVTGTDSRLSKDKIKFFDENGVELKDSDVLNPVYYTSAGTETTDSPAVAAARRDLQAKKITQAQFDQVVQMDRQRRQTNR